MVKVTVDGTVLAQSDKTVKLEGNHYFPPESCNEDLLTASTTVYVCPWKGSATYYNVTLDGKDIKDAAWSYPQPKEAAKSITGHLAFDKSKVKIEDN
ncbi:hypothetical protein EW026_g857 [Hermanssonia centrifuga]|uniref:DUF427 domain-containing protein n=1 Tax=Hermanssonia centrifuga TaxID=98765 RepID=A0A4S4KTD1_9APHY|nr:hypothetical protein EW026_g857 [Hermanssonia centrifuga]